MTEHHYQKIALAALICTMSPLGDEWRTDPGAVSRTDLTDLGFTPEFATGALSSLSAMANDRARFTAVAMELQSSLWPGRPPHPPLDVAKALVKALAGLDRETP
jgi:hypothetical protein